jgi:hypothetical protein
MCHYDVTPFVFLAKNFEPKLHAMEWDAAFVCRNFSKIQQWVVSNSFQTPAEIEAYMLETVLEVKSNTTRTD